MLQIAAKGVADIGLQNFTRLKSLQNFHLIAANTVVAANAIAAKSVRIFRFSFLLSSSHLPKSAPPLSLSILCLAGKVPPAIVVCSVRCRRCLLPPVSPPLASPPVPFLRRSAPLPFLRRCYAPLPFLRRCYAPLLFLRRCSAPPPPLLCSAQPLPCLLGRCHTCFAGASKVGSSSLQRKIGAKFFSIKC